MTTELDRSLTSRANHADNVNPNYRRFAVLVVKDGTAVYTIELTDRPDLPGTHKLTGNHGVTYGYWTEHSGRYVPIPRQGYRNVRGTLGTFDTRDTPNPDDDAPTMRVKGWATA